MTPRLGDLPRSIHDAGDRGCHFVEDILSAHDDLG
jgi:hypothetical protein